MRLRKALALSAVLSGVLLAATAPGAAADIGTGGGARPRPTVPPWAQGNREDGEKKKFPTGGQTPV
ncbi:hypothetical protein ACFWJQ_02895, partial [Streptomyces goshikiensis]|uniref:hypothetical protein n=1 Tax=Streptomyces goshikiensis TaxID=1942 RepID=UPI00364646CD